MIKDLEKRKDKDRIRPETEGSRTSSFINTSGYYIEIQTSTHLHKPILLPPFASLQ
jgi:hypothetical protein